MISPASLVAVATAVSLSSALPAPEPQGLPTPAADTVYYYFKTQVQAGQPTKFNNLYLAAYHTGAGLSDATLGETTPLPAHRGWFNGTALNWFQPDNGNNYFGFDYQGSSDMYASWSPVTINGGPGSPGLGLDAENRLVVEVNKDAWSSWVSWLGMFPPCFSLSYSRVC